MDGLLFSSSELRIFPDQDVPPWVPESKISTPLAGIKVSMGREGVGSFVGSVVGGEVGV